MVDKATPNAMVKSMANIQILKQPNNAHRYFLNLVDLSFRAAVSKGIIMSLCVKNVQVPLRTNKFYDEVLIII